MAVVESNTAAPIVAGEAEQVAQKTEKKQGNKDLQKTRLCVYYLEGKCGYGPNCTFAHSLLEVKNAPDLTKTQLCKKFAEGKCTDPNCTYAHGEEELRDPPNFKKKLCKWHQKGKCRNGTECGFAHDLVELRADAPPGFTSLDAKANKAKKPEKIAPPPGLSKISEDEGDASTDVPSSMSQAETDQSIASTSPVPEEPLFRLMAGRGSAPLQQQVALMTSAIGGLQAKLSQLEDMMLQNQVAQMQENIQQLTAQCWALESGLCMAQPPPAQPTSLKSRLNAKAVPFKPGAASDDSTSVGSD